MPHIIPEGGERINAVDALRGLAVLLMMEQHLGVWLWKEQYRLFNDPFMLCFNGLGGLAAPIFIVLAGLGASLLPFRHASPSLILILRGFIIMAFGYMLNLLTPSWFSAGTWYVLHMIGFALIISPALLRLSPGPLLAVFVAVLAGAACIQYYLETPFFLSSGRMRNMHLPGGIFRLALAEGHFPVFPWLAFFIAGLLAGTWRRQHKNRNIMYMAAACLCAGLVLAAGSFAGFSPAAMGPLLRACKLLPGFYPAFIPMVLMLISCVLFCILAFDALEKRTGIRPANPLACAGRASMTLLLAHVVIGREGAHLLKFWMIFSKAETLALIAAALALALYLAVQWNKVNYAYGAEWLMRQCAQKAAGCFKNLVT